MISSKIGHRFDSAVLSVYRFIFRQKVISPNIISVAGTVFGLLTAALILMERPVWGAVSLIIAAALDVLDGAVARGTATVTRFGGFFDSVLDRYTDMSVVGAICFVYVSHGAIEMAGVTFVAVIGTALIPYARARAEAASVECKTGLLERPERTLLLLIGLFIPVTLTYVVIILAVLTHVTVIQRIVHVWKKTGSRF